MEKSQYTKTPYQTLRLFVPVNTILDENGYLKTIYIRFIYLLDCASIWGGCDSKNNEYWAWEYDPTKDSFLEEIVSFLNK